MHDNDSSPLAADASPDETRVWVTLQLARRAVRSGDPVDLIRFLANLDEATLRRLGGV